MLHIVLLTLGTIIDPVALFITGKFINSQVMVLTKCYEAKPICSLQFNFFHFNFFKKYNSSINLKYVYLNKILLIY